MPAEDGRRIQIAWGLRANMPGMPFNQQMLFPVELTLHTTDEGIRMFAYPVREIEGTYGQARHWKDEQLEPGQNLLADIEEELLDIAAAFEVGKAEPSTGKT